MVQWNMVLLCVVVVVVILVVGYGYFKINQQVQDLTKKQLFSFKTFLEPLESWCLELKAAFSPFEYSS